jgi:DNA-binding MarR family transcriptional regulator
MTGFAIQPEVPARLALNWAVGLHRDVSLTPNERWVLVAASARAEGNANILPSVRDLTETTGLGKSTVYRALNRFRDLGLIADEEDERGRFLRFRNVGGSLLL